MFAHSLILTITSKVRSVQPANTSYKSNNNFFPIHSSAGIMATLATDPPDAQVKFILYLHFLRLIWFPKAVNHSLSVVASPAAIAARLSAQESCTALQQRWSTMGLRIND
ncbi:predicted protein [Sclerotinia sclerotiorum 1980 UF-70]|uniref:Uncharacterized protein n=1 Tax=Sclerotinia sclerotiorum (strain ATCC 18683 / 1980 / Ss-1) TaxID=665079 RepID=A7F575_SCLS1|nr:predicted protein [Sclerotinia sclerotiorum 1980 UF-70]EDN97896.1 predicted protein [Sclerotinia sclerotiorum 1980 UF-70]